MTQGRTCAHSHGTYQFRGRSFSIKLRQYIILFFIGVWLLYNAVLVSAAQQSISATCIVALGARLTGRHSELASLPWSLPGGAVVKNLLASAGDKRDTSSIPGVGRYPKEGNGSLLRYSCLEKILRTEETGGL